MDIKEKLEILNSIWVVDYACYAGECEYVLIDDTKENRDRLNSIGYDNEYIEKNCYPEGECLDICMIGFLLANTFSGNDGFTITKY